MPSKTTPVRMTGKTAMVMIRHPRLRRATVKAAKPPAKVGWHLGRATVKAAKPPAKVGWRIGKIVVARKARGQAGKARGQAGKARDQMSRARDQMGKARDQAGRVGAAGKTVGSLIVVYGPMAAEVFGLIEKPKPKRRGPAFAAGVATGAGALYALNRKNSN